MDTIKSFLSRLGSNSRSSYINRRRATSTVAPTTTSLGNSQTSSTALTPGQYGGTTRPPIPPANSGATSPVPTTITAPKIGANLPPSGSKFVQDLYDRNTGLLTDAGRSQGLREVNAPASTGTTTPASTPSGDPYIEYLKTLFNPKQADLARQNVESLNKRISDEMLRTRKREDELRKNEIGQLERGQTYQLGEEERLSNRSLADLAIAKGASVDVLNQILEAGKTAYEATQPIEVGGVLYQKQADGSFKPLTEAKKDQPATVQEYEYAVANGYKGSFTQYQNEDANRKRSIAAAGVGSTGLDSKQYTALNQVTTRFQADPIINQAVKGSTASLIADQIIANPGTATNQLKSLYVLVKNLDPDSAVREGELALANQTQSFLQQFGNTLTRITEGRVIDPAAAKSLAMATKDLMAAWNATAKKREQQYNSQANILGIGDAFGSYVQGSDLGYNSPVAPTAPSKFDSLMGDITFQGTKALLPRSIWSTLSGADKDALLAEAQADNYQLLISD